MKIKLFLLFLTITSCNYQSRQSFNEPASESGKVIGIIDGDTYDLLLSNNQTIRVRMFGVDAPERGMPFYKVAKKHLGVLIFEKQVRLIITDHDRNNRTVGKTYLPDGSEAGTEMIRAGLAWHYKAYSSDTMLHRLENEARLNKKGLWADPHPIAPWTVRKMHRDGISTKDSFR